MATIPSDLIVRFRQFLVAQGCKESTALMYSGFVKRHLLKGGLAEPEASAAKSAWKHFQRFQEAEENRHIRQWDPPTAPVPKAKRGRKAKPEETEADLLGEFRQALEGRGYQPSTAKAYTAFVKRHLKNDSAEPPTGTNRAAWDQFRLFLKARGAAHVIEQKNATRAPTPAVVAPAPDPVEAPAPAHPIEEAKPRVAGVSPLAEAWANAPAVLEWDLP